MEKFHLKQTNNVFLQTLLEECCNFLPLMGKVVRLGIVWSLLLYDDFFEMEVLTPLSFSKVTTISLFVV